MQTFTLKSVQDLIDDVSGYGKDERSAFILARLPEDQAGKHLMQTSDVAAFIQEFAPPTSSIEVEDGRYRRDDIISMLNSHDAQIRLNQMFNQQTHWVNGVQLPTVVKDYYQDRKLEPVQENMRAAQALENQRTLIGMRKTEDLLVLRNMIDTELSTRQKERESL